MTYADTVTLLVCLFMVLLSASVAKRDGARVVCAAPAVTTRTVAADPFAAGRLAFPSGGETVDDGDERGAPVAPRVQATAAPPTKRPAAPVVLPPSLARLTSRDAAHVEQQGSRLTTVQMSSAAFFEVGSAALSEQGKVILRDVAASLGSAQFAHYQITVEGHTDDAPIRSSQFPSNWELSTARASAVVHFFLDAGIAPQRLRAAGYADTFPLAPNRDAAGEAIPENQAKNRRVVIKLERVS